MIRLQLPLDLFYDLIQLAVQCSVIYNDRYCIDAAWQMFDSYIVIFKYTCKLSYKSSFSTKAILTDSDYCEILASCDTGNNSVAVFVRL